MPNASARKPGDPMLLNLRQIEMFRAVMITGSISGASQLLFVSQPAVSRLLSHTEQRVGFPLFERIKGRLYSTPEAKKLFQEVESVYRAVQRVHELAQDLSAHRSGILNLVSSPSLGQTIIPEAIACFRRLYPDVKVTLQCLAYGHLKERLLNRQADLGAIILPMSHPNLDVAPLCSNRLVCAFPHDHQLARRDVLALADLRPYPLIAYDKDTPFGQLVGDYYERAGEPLKPAIEVGSPQNACSLVQAGAGVALVDEFSVRSRLGGGHVVMREVLDAPDAASQSRATELRAAVAAGECVRCRIAEAAQATGFCAARTRRCGRTPAKSGRHRVMRHPALAASQASRFISAARRRSHLNRRLWVFDESARDAAVPPRDTGAPRPPTVAGRARPAPATTNRRRCPTTTT